MLHRSSLLRGFLLGSAFALGAGLAGPKAFAGSDPLPGDLVAPPVNINIALFYNEFNDAGQFGMAHGGTVKTDTHFSDDISVARYIRLFSLDGYTAGVQAYIPYIAFLGQQQVGVNLPSAAPGLLPPIGAGKANFSRNSGFGQPNLSAFIYPINNPETGTYAVISPWISPPVSSFSKNYALNPGQNAWNYELELGYRMQLIGKPTEPNLAVEFWGEGYLFGQNSSSSDVSPTVTANNLPPEYAFAHQYINAAIPGANPIQTQTVIPATFREQPSEEFRVYLPYEFAPAMRAFVAPGFFQSFGGKQTYKIHANGEVVDSGNRTNETQLRLVAGTFISPSAQIMVAGYYDLAARGAPVNRTILVRLGIFF
jgi:hypothetical protein